MLVQYVHRHLLNAWKRKDQSARILDLESLRILDLVVFIHRLGNVFS
jgi:hypothetical protein